MLPVPITWDSLSLTTDGMSSTFLTTNDAPSAEAMLELLLKWLPPYYSVFTPLLGGFAAQQAISMLVVYEMVYARTVGGSTGKWLTLLADNYGLKRASDESDIDLRKRIREPKKKVTKSSLENIVGQLLATTSYTSFEIVEHFEGPVFLDTAETAYAAILDNSYLFDKYNAFTLIITGLSGGVASTKIPAIITTINNSKAAGVRWWLVLR